MNGRNFGLFASANFFARFRYLNVQKELLLVEHLNVVQWKFSFSLSLSRSRKHVGKAGRALLARPIECKDVDNLKTCAGPNGVNLANNSKDICKLDRLK